ncbi:MAG: RAD55 family ATPase [Thermoplasmatota archaeon]|jgi:non-specific serine/threonine protein kinase
MRQTSVLKKFFTFEKEKKMKKHERLIEEKHKLVDEFLLKRNGLTEKKTKKSKKANNKKSKNENITERYLESLKKIEELTEKMNNEKTSFNFSFKTLFKKNDEVEKQGPDFKTFSPFTFGKNMGFFENSGSPKNINLKVFENDDVGNDFNTNIPEQDLDENTLKGSYSEDEAKEEILYPLTTKIKTINDKKLFEKQETTEIKWMKTGIPGFDSLMEKGIPIGSNIIVSGGPGTGKTIFCLQVIYNKALEGKDCVFLSMEERPERLKEHMLEFGFKVKEIKSSKDQIILSADGKGRIALKRLQPIKLARSIEALLEKASGTLPVDINLVLDFSPDDFNVFSLVIDSISAIETAFSGTKRQYRIQIEQLFRYFEDMNITTFMITESTETPQRFSNTGVEEFLSDGIIVFYNFQGVKKRARGAEIYKLRGASHSQKIVSMNITNKGIEIFPDIICI